MEDESTIEFLQPLSAAVLVGMTTVNVLSSIHGQDPTDPAAAHPIIRKYMVSMPFTMFVVGLAGLALSMAATRVNPRLLGFACAYLLGELLYIVLVGSLVTIGRSDADQRIVWSVTAGIMIAVLIVWSLMCTYPKCLRCQCCVRDVEDGAATKCGICGGLIVNCVSPTPAAEGENHCPGCHGVPALNGN